MAIRKTIPTKFQRVAAAFDADMKRVRPCDTSQYSSTDLSDLVKSFMEKNDREGEDVDENLEWFDSDNKMEILKEIFNGDDSCREEITREAELSWRLLGEDTSMPNFKRLLMSRLRDRGFDAGLCKSSWEKNKRIPAGEHEYIDVNFAGNRYIVEISLAAEFQIARPTNQYSALLDVFPLVFVGKVEELKRVVRVMCSAIEGSMKNMDLHIPPWRRSGYMQAKWFSPYKRTTKSSVGVFPTRRPISIGFGARPLKSYKCRDDFGSKHDFRVGHLITGFDADGLGMQL